MVMEEVFGAEAVKNFCKLNAFKYLWRADEKDGMNDIRKARWYLEWIESMGDEKDEGDEEAESDEREDVSEHLYDAFRNLYETISNGIKMYAEAVDHESEASKRLRYFQYFKKQGYDEDVCFITALRTDMEVIEKRLKDIEEEEDEQSSEKSGED